MTKPADELLRDEWAPASGNWTDPSVDFEARRGTWSYPAAAKNLKYLGFPNPRDWSPTDADWKLPENWREILHEGLKERLAKYRSLRLFLDVCVRCGACADKCHFFIGSGDPKNMPVLRAELLRSIYRKDFTIAGRLFGSLAGARELTPEILKEWYYYFYQCTECRRCSVFCPYGIDTAEITMIARELLNLVGLNINWVMEPVANCHRTGNHLGIPPQTFKDNIEFLSDELADMTGVRIEPSINRKGAEMLFVIPSADYFADPGIFTFMGYLLLFEHIGLDYTLSAYASEGGNFGLFTSHETIKRLNAKIYAEAKRLGVKWILGGECGHMWRVAAPVHGHDERAGRLPRGAGVAHHRDALRQRRLDQDGPHLRVHGRPDARQASCGWTSRATTTCGSPSTTRATRRGPWACSRSRARSSAASATTSSRCPRTRSASRPSAAAAARGSATTRTWRCACAAACPAARPWPTSGTGTA